MHILRIELHNARNYDALHIALGRRGIIRTITAGNGVTYQLDTGTYYYHGNVETSVVLELAKAAARECGHSNASIIVAKAEHITWTGLDAVSMRRGA